MPSNKTSARIASRKLEIREQQLFLPLVGMLREQLFSF
jgi:hypothetical protein